MSVVRRNGKVVVNVPDRPDKRQARKAANEAQGLYDEFVAANQGQKLLLLEDIIRDLHARISYLESKS